MPGVRGRVRDGGLIGAPRDVSLRKPHFFLFFFFVMESNIAGPEDSSFVGGKLSREWVFDMLAWYLLACLLGSCTRRLHGIYIHGIRYNGPHIYAVVNPGAPRKYRVEALPKGIHIGLCKEISDWLGRGYQQYCTGKCPLCWGTWRR